jgi:hypothetical protein
VLLVHFLTLVIILLITAKIAKIVLDLALFL